MNLATVSPEAWVFAGSAVVAICTLLGLCVPILLNQRSQMALAKLNAELAAKDRQAAAQARTEIKDKIDNNTEITSKAAQTAEAVKMHLEGLPKHRIATAMALRAESEIPPEFFEIRLPGFDYEIFGLSTGSLVEWRSIPCDRGRKVKFLTHGAAEMGFHFHKSAECVFGVRGTIYFETASESIVISPGEYYVAKSDEAHSVALEEAGEADVHWPEQESDTMLIGYFPRPEQS